LVASRLLCYNERSRGAGGGFERAAGLVTISAQRAANDDVVGAVAPQLSRLGFSLTRSPAACSLPASTKEVRIKLHLRLRRETPRAGITTAGPADNKSGAGQKPQPQP
jgi:hypothetical protein